jgi:hypothetical protein
MAAYVARAAAEHGYQRHRYRLADFGLTAGDVRERLARWRVEAEPLAA